MAAKGRTSRVVRLEGDVPVNELEACSADLGDRGGKAEAASAQEGDGAEANDEVGRRANERAVSLDGHGAAGADHTGSGLHLPILDQLRMLQLPRLCSTHEPLP